MSGAKGRDLWSIIKMVSTAGTGHTYVTRRNHRNTPNRLVLRRFDPVVCRHMGYEESR